MLTMVVAHDAAAHAQCARQIGKGDGRAVSTPQLPRVFTVIPTPSVGEPVIVDGVPGLILDLLGQIDGVWLVHTSRGQDCAIQRPFRRMGDSMAWLARPVQPDDRAA